MSKHCIHNIISTSCSEERNIARSYRMLSEIYNSIMLEFIWIYYIYAPVVPKCAYYISFIFTLCTHQLSNLFILY